MGTQPLIFLDAIDAPLQVESHLVQCIIDLLHQLQPETVLVPFPMDDHPDHRQTSAILAAVLEPSGLGPHCYCYEV